MKFAFTVAALGVVSALFTPPPPQVASRNALQQREEHDTSSVSAYLEKRLQDLWKRRGGGGSGGRGGGSSGGSSSGGSSSSGGRGSSSSSAGGRTTTGSGPTPAYGGGRYYGGGAAVPYKSTAGARSPSGILPFALGAGLALAFWPGIWLHGANMYPYNRPYSYHNASSNQNETKPVLCACEPESVCGCDENGDRTFMESLIGNGSYDALNKSVVNVAQYNGSSTILINGTLPNGTTAPGGDEDPDGDDGSGSAGVGMSTLLRNAGWWPVVATVCGMVFLL
ncbi:hypothetical protein B0H63DRAFT_22969 [Podospora didyma]|uniref:DUF7732 domain-containing protein n=1 Tax=Podospora didyma TaxID=330526 RepID=A0AAE0P639_9PEZI|nr:hypothetical protein B0H63DRAFT_22969 [Podospora didyma]